MTLLRVVVILAAVVRCTVLPQALESANTHAHRHTHSCRGPKCCPQGPHTPLSSSAADYLAQPLPDSLTSSSSGWTGGRSRGEWAPQQTRTKARGSPRRVRRQRVTMGRPEGGSCLIPARDPRSDREGEPEGRSAECLNPPPRNAFLQKLGVLWGAPRKAGHLRPRGPRPPQRGRRTQRSSHPCDPNSGRGMTPAPQRKPLLRGLRRRDPGGGGVGAGAKEQLAGCPPRTPQQEWERLPRRSCPPPTAWWACQTSCLHPQKWIPGSGDLPSREGCLPSAQLDCTLSPGWPLVPCSAHIAPSFPPQQPPRKFPRA